MFLIQNDFSRRWRPLGEQLGEFGVSELIFSLGEPEQLANCFSLANVIFNLTKIKRYFANQWHRYIIYSPEYRCWRRRFKRKYVCDKLCRSPSYCHQHEYVQRYKIAPIEKCHQNISKVSYNLNIASDNFCFANFLLPFIRVFPSATQMAIRSR